MFVGRASCKRFLLAPAERNRSPTWVPLPETLRDRIRTGSGSDRPKIHLRIVAQTPLDFSSKLPSQKLSIGPVATARGSDTVKCPNLKFVSAKQTDNFLFS
jgi:hypothetical protein